MDNEVLELWRWRAGVLMISLSAAWLVSGTVLVWMFAWKPLAVGHAGLWLWVTVSGSEQMRRYYFKRIGKGEGKP